MEMNTEWFPLVNETGEVTGKATRTECHNGSKLLHPVVHLHLLNPAGELYLQKRSILKDIQPGKWDTAVGGHVDYDEGIEDALFREAFEELGISGFQPCFVARYVYESDVEKELVNTYITISDITPIPDGIEIDEGRFWKTKEILSCFRKNLFTPNFEFEFETILSPYIQKMQTEND